MGRVGRSKSLQVTQIIGCLWGGWLALAEFCLVYTGLSTLGPTPEAVGEYLTPLLDFAKSVIPHDQLASTPIYLLATAGMRLLPAEQQSAVLAATCDFIKSYPFRVDACHSNVRIITGEEEGLYGWIAVNYLMDGFDKHEHASSGPELLRHSSTYGFLDMGGASTQIAFEPSEEMQVAHADNLREVKLQLLSGKEVKHPVFVTTWLGFGTNQAKDRYVDALVRTHLRATDKAHAEIDPADPAAPTNDPHSTTIDDPCLPKSLLLTDERHPDYTLRGTGDFASCVRRTGPLLNKEVACLDEPCLFNGVHVPPIDFSVNHFIGISEYYYSTHDVWSLGGVYDFVEFERNAVEYCGKDWDDIMKDFKAGSKWKSSMELSRLEAQCFKAAWIINILHEGIGIPRLNIDAGGEGDDINQTEKGLLKAAQKGLLPLKPPSFQSLDQVGDVAVSWTLGKMVLEVAKGVALAPPVNAEPVTVGAGDDAAPDRFRTDPDPWKGHVPSWKGGVGATIDGVRKADPIPMVGLVVVVGCLWYFCFGSGAKRRRNSFAGTVLGRRQRSGDFTLISQEEGAFGSDSASSGGSRSPTARGRKAPVGLVGKMLSPVRWGVGVVSSYLRQYSGSRSRGSAGTGLLPMAQRTTSVPQPGGGGGQDDPYRPRALRQGTAPFTRVSSLGNLPTAASSQYTNQSGQQWNDAPDLDAVRRTQSSGRLGMHASASTTSLAARVASPPPGMNVIPPTPISRPTTPGLRAGSGLSKLTARTPTGDGARSVTPNREMQSGMVTPPTGGGGALATAAWEALGEAGGTFEAAPGGAGAGAVFSSPSATPAGGVASVKLRGTKSANSSRTELSAGYFHRPGSRATSAGSAEE